MRKFIFIVMVVIAALVVGNAAAGNGYGDNHGKDKHHKVTVCFVNGDNKVVIDSIDEHAVDAFLHAHAPSGMIGTGCKPKYTPPPCEWQCSPPPVDQCPTIEGIQTDKSLCPPVVTPQLPLVKPAGPNKDAFCYGDGAKSYTWDYTPEQVVTFDWKTLYVANVTKGVDQWGVMTNGFTPTCAKGTPTGQYVDNQGWWTLSGFSDFTGMRNPQGTLTVPEHYQVVTIP